MTLTYDYDHFCEDVAQGAGDSASGRVVRVIDVKNVPEWDLVPVSGGYQMAMCSSPGEWRIENQGDRLSIVDGAGAAAGSVERTKDGFVVKDGAGASVRSGTRTAEGIELSDGAGVRIGTLKMKQGHNGVPSSATFTDPVGRSDEVQMRRGSWLFGFWSVEPRSIMPVAVTVLDDMELAPPFRGALVVFFLEHRDEPLPKRLGRSPRWIGRFNQQ